MPTRPLKPARLYLCVPVRRVLAVEGAPPNRPGTQTAVAHDPFPRLARVIFKRVGDERPYPEHGYTIGDWAKVPPRQVRLDDLVTTKRTLDLGELLSEDSTFYGDLFAHVVDFQGDLYLEDGLHRALRAALQQRQILHARVLELSS
jgi:Arc/MetJ family transcription regulator